ncbi:MAG: LysR family transcriptional regulator [Verrucomicrobia bacterium]|nr:LysR family transcriptional regulator [Verrucomicrobiota bacterium]
MTQPLDSRQLRAFVILAQTGSFTQTAKKLFLSQSAISHAMKALEENVGCRLLDRVGKKVALTQAGEQLVHHAEKILQEMGAARDSLQHLSKWGKGRIRLGASSTACQYILPGVLREFKQSFPECHVTIEPGDTEECVDLVQDNRVDLAVTMQPRHAVSLEFLPLFTDELSFLMAPLHPWATTGHVVREEIPRQNYVLYNKNSYTFRLIEEYFRDEEMVLNTVIELGSMEAIKELVKLGVGLSILAPWIAHRELEENSLVAVPLGRRKLKRHWGILHRCGKRLSLAEETFVGLCRSVTAELSAKLF